MTNEWDSSRVMIEFEKIAKETGLITTDFEKRDYVGNPSKETPVKDHRRYEPTEEYNITKETGKELIEKAHPKSVTMADAMGNGGLVENEVQQQEKDIEIALKMPNGALIGIHASVVSELVKLANHLEDMGKHKEAIRVDETIRRIASRPFDKRAGFWFVPALVAGVAGTTGSAAWLGLGKYFTSTRESLGIDTKDLLEVFQKAVSKGATSADEAVVLLTPIASAFEGLDLKDKTQFEKYIQQVQNLTSSMPKLKSILAKTKLELGTGRWYHFGFDIASRMDEKMADVEKGLQETKELLNQAKTLSEQADVPTDNITDLQKILFETGFKGKLWTGKITKIMDETTISATKELEKSLDEAIAKSNIGATGSMIGQIINNGKLIIDVKKLKRIIDLLEKT